MLFSHLAPDIFQNHVSVRMKYNSFYDAGRVNIKADRAALGLQIQIGERKSVSCFKCGTASQHLLHSGEEGGAGGAGEKKQLSMSQGWDRDSKDDLM